MDQMLSLVSFQAFSFTDVHIPISLASSCLHRCCCLVAQLCLTVCNPMDCSPPGSSVHGILQARTLEWVAISFSRGSSLPRDRTCVSCIADGFFTTEPPGKPKISLLGSNLCIIKLTHFKCTGMGVLVNFDSLLEMLCKWNRTRRLAALTQPSLTAACPSFVSFLLWKSVSLIGHITFCLSILQLIDIWIGFSSIFMNNATMNIHI